VVADYHMPGMDGAALAAAIKGDPNLHHPAFVLLTSVSHCKYARRTDNFGIDACLVKPVRQAKLLDTLAAVWSAKRARLGSRITDPSYPDSSTNMGRSLAALNDRAKGRLARGGFRVLVVEDNAINQKVAVMLLEKLGIEADVASNGLEGVRILDSRRYDAVLMDCQMPEMNGYEAADHVRLTEGPNRSTPIIAMTAQAIEGSRERCLEHGMDDFISKPVRLEDLTKTLESWIAKTRPAHLAHADVPEAAGVTNS